MRRALVLLACLLLTGCSALGPIYALNALGGDLWDSVAGKPSTE